MPRNRRHIDRDERVGQLLDAAERRLVEGGDAALSVADIAREVGIAPSAVYWYFPTRDDLLVATVERLMVRVFAGKPQHHDLVEEILWVAKRLGEYQTVRMAVHERARTSPVVAEFQGRFATTLDALVVNRLTADGWSAADAKLTTDAVRAVVEGALLADMSAARRTRVIRFALARLLPAEDGGRR